MKQRIIAASAAALGASAAVAACSSSPSSTTGSEVLSGTSTEVASNTIPLTAHGVSADHGSITLAGNGSHGVIKLAKGNVDVEHSSGNAGSPSVDKANCTATDVTAGTYEVTGGTGAYKGATGSGHFTVTFTESAMTHGKCDPSALSSPSFQPASGRATFQATGHWTLK
jgi:hypothetical protein